ncbi:hypothetical protein XENTR_v10015031 [Xenopus tropicalis]|nr:hypothetical protein XENTR_v10015031 [Xenopus tropicalis]
MGKQLFASNTSPIVIPCLTAEPTHHSSLSLFIPLGELFHSPRNGGATERRYKWLLQDKPNIICLVWQITYNG